MLLTDRGISWARRRTVVSIGLLVLAATWRAVAQDPPVNEVAYVFRFSRAPVKATGVEALPPVLRRRLTVTLRQVTVERALREITNLAQLDLSYSRAVVPLLRMVSVAVVNGTTAEALRQVLYGAPVELWVTRNG